MAIKLNEYAFKVRDPRTGKEQTFAQPTVKGDTSNILAYVKRQGWELVWIKALNN